MPRVSSYSKEDIVAAGLKLVRRNGESALTARNLAQELGCSTSPIFTAFDNIEEIKLAVRKAASAAFLEYEEGALDFVPAFKEYGMRLVRFAKEEQNLFKMLFLNPEAAQDGLDAQASACVDAFVNDYCLTEEQAMILFNQTWTFSCGLALLNASGAEALSDQEISDQLSRQFISVLSFLKSGKEIGTITPRKRVTDDEKITLPVDL